MRCVLCGGPLGKRTLDEEIRVGNDHFLVWMEVEVCQNCNERYYNEGQVDTLIELKKRLAGERGEHQPVGTVYQVRS